SRRAVGLHLTRSRLHGVVADLTGQVIERRSIEIDPGRPVPALIAELAATARELARHGRGELLGVGVGMPGPVDPEEGVHAISTTIRARRWSARAGRSRGCWTTRPWCWPTRAWARACAWTVRSCAARTPRPGRSGTRWCGWTACRAPAGGGAAPRRSTSPRPP